MVYMLVGWLVGERVRGRRDGGTERREGKEGRE